MKTVEELHEEYGFPIEDYFKDGKAVISLHPVYKKWLPICWEIENIYGHVENANMSLGKARELTAAVIEKHANKPDSGWIPREKELQEALKPFYLLAVEVLRNTSKPDSSTLYGYNHADITFGDLRRAIKAIEAPTTNP